MQNRTGINLLDQEEKNSKQTIIFAQGNARNLLLALDVKVRFYNDAKKALNLDLIYF